tara:strand:+ start:324 stop:614 length:291 start_codon:yes stop_codon:yes gene_type:complete
MSNNIKQHADICEARIKSLKKGIYYELPTAYIKKLVAELEQELEQDKPFCVWMDGTSCHEDELEDYHWMSDDYYMSATDPNEEPELDNHYRSEQEH